MRQTLIALGQLADEILFKGWVGGVISARAYLKSPQGPEWGWLMPVLHFVISSLIFFLIQLPMMLLSFVVTPILCLTKWDGFTTWFGNDKWGRGDTHYKAPSEGVYWRQVRFLCIRNPVANFGTLGPTSIKDRPPGATGFPWLHESHLGGSWYWKYGWKNPRDGGAGGWLPGGSLYQPDGRRSFVYRPWMRRK